MHEEPCGECEKFLTDGFEFIKNRAWGKAKACYEKALAVHSNNEKAWINLGRCYDRLGNAGKAFECYEEALHCNYIRTHELVNKGSMLMMGKKFKERNMDGSREYELKIKRSVLGILDPGPGSVHLQPFSEQRFHLG